jgi:pyruvate dehydrogenase E1 component alpha subunit
MADLLALYRHAVRARLLDDRLAVLSRAGRIGYHPDAQRAELVVVAATAALGSDDWVFPTPRDHAAALVRGASAQQYLDHVCGNEADVLRGHGTPGTFASRALRIASPSVQVSQHLTHAAGLAWAARLRKTTEVVLAFFNETAADAGDFHSAVNFAGVVKAPIVFVCKTDGTEAPAPDVEVHDKGVAYGVPSEECAGNAGAVFDRVSAAIARARAGEGPTLLEVRISTEPDPLEKLRAALLAEGALTESDDFAFRREVLAELEHATVAAFDKALPPLDSLFENVFSGGTDGRLTSLLESQRASLRAARLVATTEGQSR